MFLTWEDLSKDEQEQAIRIYKANMSEGADWIDVLKCIFAREDGDIYIVL